MSPITFAKWGQLAMEHRYCAERIAKSIGISGRTLTRFFQNKFGLCPTEWFEQLRQQRAVALLAEGQGTVKEISFGLGYLSASAFCRAFRSRHGFSPKEFRDVFGGPGTKCLPVMAHPALVTPATESVRQLNRLMN